MPDPDDIVIHGIRPRDLADSPTPDEVLPHVVGALADRDVVAHVAHIEESLLAPWLARGGFQLPRELIDTDVLTQLYSGPDPSADPARTCGSGCRGLVVRTA